MRGGRAEDDDWTILLGGPAVALQAVLLTVADWRMAWTVAGLSSSYPLRFFFLLCSPLFLFSSSVSHGAVAECSVMALKAALLVVADRRMAWLFFFFFSVFFFLLCSPLFLFSSSVSHGAVVVCAAVEVAGRWSCCGRRRWLFSFLCRGVSLFFFSALSLPLCLVFFSPLRSPSTVFLFHRVLWFGFSSGFYSQRTHLVTAGVHHGGVKHAPSPDWNGSIDGVHLLSKPSRMKMMSSCQGNGAVFKFKEHFQFGPWMFFRNFVIKPPDKL